MWWESPFGIQRKVFLWAFVRQIFYVSTAGDVQLIEAVGLDIYGADVEAIMEAAEETIEKLVTAEKETAYA